MIDFVKNILTQRQIDILIGNLLGDGFLIRPYVSTSFGFKQKQESKEYVFWLYNEFKNICRSEPKQRKDNQQWYFLTKSIKDLNVFREMFYSNKKKIIPKNIEQLLVSPLSLAIWYMDDGSIDYRPNDHCSFYLSTHCFSVKEVEKLRDILMKNFGIESNVYNNLIRGKRYPRIYIGSKGRNKFIKIISPYILNCFKYKLPQYRQPLRDFSRIKLERCQVPDNQENKLT